MEAVALKDRKLRSQSDSDCFQQKRAQFMSRLRGSLPIPDEAAIVKETPEEYSDFLSPIPVHQMYTIERAVAAVTFT